MMLSCRAPLIATVVCLGHWSANTAFAFSPANVKHSSASSEHTSTSLHYSRNRRSLFTIVPTAAVTTFATLFIPPGGDGTTTTNKQYRAYADEPNNLYYKSKADEDDPLAVFGRSLQQSIIDAPSSNDSKESDPNKDGADAPKSEVTGQQFLQPGGDLGRALMEKQQQRRIDPRTHG
mmetsp:Transcript_7292/g.10648  ORF Transcript_7292/g.10648 Transcript_7292/m.10648 type:complete len:177 (+) Transcript_7292:78-608(+)